MGKFAAILGGSKPKAPALPPPVDPAIERAKSENEATAKANAEAAAKKRSRRASSLLAAGSEGAGGDGMTSGASAAGKAKLGE